MGTKKSKNLLISTSLIFLLIILIGLIIYFTSKNSSPHPSPHPSPHGSPHPSPHGSPHPSPSAPSGTTGNGLTTNTYFSVRESPGYGSCGGCGANWTSKPQGRNDFPNMALELLSIKTTNGSLLWMGAAAAESMATPYCTTCAAKNLCDCGKGTAALKANGNTASAPCGSSFRIFIQEINNNKGGYINIVIVDACPHDSNIPWCPKKPGDRNNPWGSTPGSYNHFDLWVGNSEKVFTSKLGCDVGKLTTSTPGYMRKFESIPTPPEVMALLKKECCNTWWKNQGCPNICGPGYNYPPNCPASTN